MKTNTQNQILASQVGLITQLAALASLNGQHDFFTSYSPHVNWIEIRFYKGKWDSDKTAESCSTYLDDPNWLSVAAEFINSRCEEIRPELVNEQAG